MSLQTSLDLFPALPATSMSEYQTAFDGWLGEVTTSGQVRQRSSSEVYAHMWASLAEWAGGNQIKLQALSADDLEEYLASRGGGGELSSRYAWRLLRLVERVTAHRARAMDRVPNAAAADTLARRPELRFANAHGKDPLPDYLQASEAKRLVTFLSEVRPGRGAGASTWQEIRNRTSVALILGSGVTPGELRSLKLADVVIASGRRQGLPWKLQISAGSNGPARETPLAAWAGHLLKYWLETRIEQQIPGEALFPSARSTGKPWGKVAQYNAATEVLAAAGIDQVAGGSFRLRHTFALRQLRRGTSVYDVARWLGISDAAAAAQYSRILTLTVDVI